MPEIDPHSLVEMAQRTELRFMREDDLRAEVERLREELDEAYALLRECYRVVGSDDLAARIQALTASGEQT